MVSPHKGKADSMVSITHADSISEGKSVINASHVRLVLCLAFSRIHPHKRIL